MRLLYPLTLLLTLAVRAIEAPTDIDNATEDALAQDTVTGNIPSLPNYCGRFLYDAYRVGHLFANEYCEDVDFAYPEDTRPHEFRDKPIFAVLNENCLMCLFFGKRGCTGDINYIGGSKDTKFNHFAPSMSYYCRHPRK